MKVFTLNYNGILDGLIAKLKASNQWTDNYHEADVFVLWQDVRGDCGRVAKIAKTMMDKPVVVVQHGRAATRDYCPPNQFELQADKICVWGESDKDRLLKRGIADERIEVVGCPLFSRLRPRVLGPERQGKNVLFVPVISQSEEPENLLVYAAIKRWECTQLIRSLQDKMAGLKGHWATEENTMRDGKLWKKEIVHKIPRNIIYEYGLLNVKLTGIHDAAQYMAPLAMTEQGRPGHIEETIELLRNVDVMVCLEEGTMQLLACALDIPVIVVDIFQYGNYGGVAGYDRVEKVLSPAVQVTRSIEKVGSMVDHALANPMELRKHRIAVCEKDGGAHLGDADARIIRVLESLASVPA